MRLGTLIKLGVVLWLAVEGVLFVLVAKMIGFPEALLLAFLTSVLGWTLLKRAGASAMTKLRAALDGRRIVEGNGPDVFDDTLASLGALALIMPGFLSDAAGLILAVPAARTRLARWIGGGRLARIVRGDHRGSARDPSTIDLDPRDWERTESFREPVSKY